MAGQNAELHCMLGPKGYNPPNTQHSRGSIKCRPLPFIILLIALQVIIISLWSTFSLNTENGACKNEPEDFVSKQKNQSTTPISSPISSFDTNLEKNRGIAQIIKEMVPTKMRDEPVPIITILPSSYDTNTNQTYSVLYMVHPAGGNHLTYSRISDLPSISNQYDMIIVCPDAGTTSWYFDSPLDPTYQYETFTSKELISYIDTKYRTRPSYEHRAVMGASMGGHGSLFLSIRHPDVFGTAVSLSGGVDIRPFPTNWDIAKRIGTIEEYPERWDALSVMELARENLSKESRLNIAMDIGLGDFFLEVNRKLNELLVELEVEHDYTERPGKHDFKYWRKVIPYQMIFVDEHINRTPSK